MFSYGDLLLELCVGHNFANFCARRIIQTDSDSPQNSLPGGPFTL